MPFLHYPVKIVECNQSVPGSIRLSNHLMQLIISDALSDLLRDFAQILIRNAPRVVFVEEFEHLVYLFSGALISEAGSNHPEEVLESEAPSDRVLVHLVEASRYVLLFEFVAEGAHRRFELTTVDGA